MLLFSDNPTKLFYHIIHDFTNQKKVRTDLLFSCFNEVLSIVYSSEDPDIPDTPALKSVFHWKI